MVKKLLFTFLFLFSLSAFSQKSIQKVTAAPNPFEYKTNISLVSSKDQVVFFSVKNILGRTIISRKVSIKKGKNTIPFQKDNLRSGVYIYIIQSGKESTSKRLVIK